MKLPPSATTYGMAAARHTSVGFVVVWQEVEPHAAFLERLRQEHRRNHSFWPLVEGKHAVTG